MSILTITDLNYELPDKVLYKDSSLRLNKGEHLGLTGKNGAGKSTLLKMIQGEILPDSGQIVWQNNLRISYLEQQLTFDEGDTIFDYLKRAFNHLYEMNDKIQALYMEYAESYDDALLEEIGQYQDILENNDFYNIETEIERVATGLGITALGLDREVEALSGGQRSKVSLAKLLLEKADVFLLDEPTNYLDVEHIEWLSDYLNQLEDAYIVISHDRDFLNRVTNCICDIEFQVLSKYMGNYDKAMKQKEAQQEHLHREYEKQQKEIDKLETYIRKYKAGSRSTMAKSREKQLNRMDRLTPPVAPKPGHFHFPYSASHGNLVVEAKRLEIGYGKKALLPPINLLVQNGEKIAISGFNGIGKSTLLKTLIGEIPVISGDIELSREAKISYFSQDLVWDNPHQSAFDWIKEQFPKLNNKEVRRYLSRSGIVDDNVTKALDQLSGGEQTKVKLCSLTLKKSNFLILDEPTNHLDQGTKDGLKRALKDFEGTLIVVSHEPEFFDGLVDKQFDVESNTMKHV
ncbi:ABC-F family ATP-binding cassette domain-containing protein [Vagococcus fluvialis]|uniref:ABC-F family ATP-binding cassette domain-containing protein n=2 Tax=Vagococcus fluvialis TaxID=2738 RepID=A0A7X6DAP5_9ENTE|nr:ABC-F family ATP-binding cassette domain-containing protein [Vagococcus fluvialis]NKC68895.1 ABC-F family ATP-binding cassette domain-containing protein [Vagococcus fluvialis]